MSDLNSAVVINAIILGDSCVGKTTFYNMLINQNVENSHPHPTVVPMEYCYINIQNYNKDDELIKVQISDTGGAERFQSLRILHIRNQDVILIFFNSELLYNDSKIFDRQFKQVLDNARRNFSVLFVFNFMDKIKNDPHKQEYIKKLCKQIYDEVLCYGYKVSYVSLVEGDSAINCKEKFEEICREMYAIKKAEREDIEIININDDLINKKKCCPS